MTTGDERSRTYFDRFYTDREDLTHHSRNKSAEEGVQLHRLEPLNKGVETARMNASPLLIEYH